ncbi:MAG: FAD-dependent oxidoreductase [Candidatus Hydrothermarchaeota archaeon]
MKLVIIGAGGAGLPAASTARDLSKDVDIKVITNRNYIAYSPCSIPFVLGGEIESFEAVIMHDPVFYKRERNIDILKETVVEIDRENKLVVTNKKEKIPYDKLIIATGAKNIIPNVPGTNLNGVFPINTDLEGSIHLKNYMQGKKNVVVIGAGAIGLELAYAFAKRSFKTSLVEIMPQILPNVLDKDMAKMVENEVTKKINLHLSSTLEEIKGENKVESVKINGKIIKSDIIILATGMKPNIDLAEKCGINIGELGGIVVDEYMRTNDEDIFAAGDCCETKFLLTNSPVLSLFGTTAIRQGRVAGTNAVNLSKKFPGVLNSMVTLFGELEIGATGLSESLAKKEGFKPLVAKISSFSKARFMHGTPIHAKLIFDKREERLIGGQVVGYEGVSHIVDRITMGIWKGVTIEDLENIETCYAPPVACVEDILTKAIRKVEGRRTISCM